MVQLQGLSILAWGIVYKQKREGGLDLKSGRIEQSSHNETYMGFFFFAKAGSNWVAWVQSNLLKDEFLEY